MSDAKLLAILAIGAAIIYLCGFTGGMAFSFLQSLKKGPK